jgi:hypothetical protein
MIDRLCYRMYREGDLPALLALWERVGWGAITPEIWRSWFVDTPHGACLIAVALTSEGEVVGQEMFTPTVLQVGGKEMRALRLSAPILREDIRSASMRSVRHPAIALWLTGSIAAASLGYQVVYALPERAWLPFFSYLYRFETAEYRCLAASHGACAGDSRLLARPVQEFGSEHEALWESARRRFPIDCGVRHDAVWLRYRLGGSLAFDVRDERGALVGYSAVKLKNGLLADAVAATPDDLREVLAATLWALADPAARAAAPDLVELKVMETPALAPVLAGLPFVPVDYSFAFVCDVLDPTLPEEELAPARWYLMPGD